MRQATNDTVLMTSAVPKRMARCSVGTPKRTLCITFPASQAPSKPRMEEDRIYDPKNREVRSQADRDRGKRGDRERRRFVELAKGEAKIVVHEQTYSARKAATCSNADIAAYSLVIDAALELPLVFCGIEMAFRISNQTVLVDLPKFVAAKSKAFSRAARSGVRSS